MSTNERVRGVPVAIPRIKRSSSRVQDGTIRTTLFGDVCSARLHYLIYPRVQRMSVDGSTALKSFC